MATAKKRGGAAKKTAGTKAKKTTSAAKPAKPAARRAVKGAKKAAPKRATVQRKARAQKTAGRASRGVASAGLLAIPAISDAERSAFEAQFTADECDAAGARTKAPKVLAEAIAAVEQIGPTVAAGVMRYGTNRLRFLIDLLSDLAERVAFDQSQRDRGAQSRGELEAAMVEASDAREEMQHVLGLMARGSTKALDELDRARSQEDLSVSLKLLATSAEHWLGRNDPTAKAMVTAHALTQADVDGAHRAARRLEKALTAARAGMAPTRDLPETNRIEGRVIKEIGVLHEAVTRARAGNGLIPSLKLGPTLKREIAHRVVVAKPVDDGPRPSVPPAPGTQ
ncbi:MAG: hypothetical protein R3A52_10725 [Polyangiales bacterium]